MQLGPCVDHIHERSKYRQVALETRGRSKPFCQILQSHRELVEAACWKFVLITAQNFRSTSDSG